MYELEVKSGTDQNKTVCRILFDGNNINVSDDSNKHLKKATEYILERESIVSYREDREVHHRKLQGASLETLEILQKYFENNYKFKTKLHKIENNHE